MENSPQVDVLARLLGPELARMVVALTTLAEVVVGLNEQITPMQQAAERAADDGEEAAP